MTQPTTTTEISTETPNYAGLIVDIHHMSDPEKYPGLIDFFSLMATGKPIVMLPLTKVTSRDGRPGLVFNRRAKIETLITNIRKADGPLTGLAITFETVGELPHGVNHYRGMAFFNEGLVCDTPPKGLFGTPKPD